MTNLIDLLDSIIGRSYTPVVDSVTGQIAEGFAGVDWSYVCSCALLFFAVWCFFGVVLAFFRKR